MINQFKDEYQKLINDFSVIDENDPITEEKLTFKFFYWWIYKDKKWFKKEKE